MTKHHTADVEDGTDEEKASLARVRAQNDVYERNMRFRCWEIGVPVLATLACIACFYWCESCLLGVMLFCILLCCKDWVLVLVFITSLLLFISRHPVDKSTMHHITDAAIEFSKSE